MGRNQAEDRLRMTLPRLKVCYYALTAFNTIASQYYFSYLFFFLRDRFGFGNRGNLMVAALHGAIYIYAAWNGGRFAERRGYLTSMTVGFAGLAACLALSSQLNSAVALIAMVVPYTLALLLIWPAVEALVIEHEPASRIPHIVGVYNLTWSTATALAYFSGGPLYEWLGRAAVFIVPGMMFLGSFLFVLWLRPRAAAVMAALPPVAVEPMHHPDAQPDSQRVPPQTFLRLAWIANPFAYMAMYTVLAVMPDLAVRLGLSPSRVGLFCSVWFFSRVAAFGGLWAWPGWHYRFRWMVTAFLVIIVGFAAILLAPALWVIVMAQIFFGLAAGLIYYSSLFYSMDVGEAKGEHGGLHEAAIGIGICAGPLIGTLSLQFFPQVASAGAIAVSGLLSVGCVALVTVWARARWAVDSH